MATVGMPEDGKDFHWLVGEETLCGLVVGDQWILGTLSEKYFVTAQNGLCEECQVILIKKELVNV